MLVNCGLTIVGLRCVHTWIDLKRARWRAAMSE
jgi:hypothetical protein